MTETEAKERVVEEAVKVVETINATEDGEGQVDLAPLIAAVRELQATR